MNIRDLTYLIALAKYQHFGKAAKACFVSQPTLSAQLKKLEDELGVTLFERHNKKVFLSPAAQPLIDQAQTILRETQQLKELARTQHDPYSGQFRLGIIPTLGPYLLPPILPVLKKQLPHVQFIWHEDKTANILNALQKGHLDGVILALPVMEHGLEKVLLFKEDFYVALPKQHALAKHAVLTIKELQQENLLLLEEGHCLRDQILAVCRGVNENTDFHATSLETLVHLVAYDYGITLLPALAAEKIIRKDIVIKPLHKNSAHRTIGMLWRKQSAKKLCAEKIAELIKSLALTE